MKKAEKNHDEILSFVEKIKKHVDEEVTAVQLTAFKGYNAAVERIEEKVAATLSQAGKKIAATAESDTAEELKEDSRFFIEGNQMIQKSMENLHDHLEESRRLTKDALAALLQQSQKPVE